jgi:hypothetical protein
MPGSPRPNAVDLSSPPSRLLDNAHAEGLNCTSMKAVLLSRLRSAITLGLILWCAGAGCMIVSYAHSAAMSGAGAATLSASAGVSGQAHGSKGAHDCCKARHASGRLVSSSMANHSSASESSLDLEELSEVPGSSNAMNCCPLTSGTLVVTGRQRISDADTTVLRSISADSFLDGFIATTVAIPLRLPNQNQTYLRGCVFLI